MIKELALRRGGRSSACLRRSLAGLRRLSGQFGQRSIKVKDADQTPKVFLRWVLVICILTGKVVFSQDYCGGNRFEEIVFAEYQVGLESNIVYANALNKNGNYQDLMLDLYYPLPEFDTSDKRPLIVYIHGGGLIGGSKESDGATDLGVMYSQMGYVFASVEYRIGWDSGDSCNGNVDDYYRAQYRGVQDVKAAIRYLIEFSNDYKIDTGFIFGSGTSAGSNLILYAAYATQENFKEELYSEFGSIDSSGNSYYDHGVDLKGLVLESAGLEDTILFHAKSIPTLYFHGSCDAIVPFFNGPMYSCFSPVEYPWFYGSWEQSQILDRLGHAYHFYIGEGGGHDVAPPDTILAYASVFIKNIFCDELLTRTIYRVVGPVKCAVDNNVELFVANIYPNPVEDYIEMMVSSGRDKDIDMVIYSTAGQIMEGQALPFNPPIRTYIIDVSALPRGMYFMVLSQHKGKYLFPFVK